MSHVKIPKEGVARWNEWRVKHPETQPLLAGADLRREMLRGVNLRDADLAGANLRDANLRYADLSGSTPPARDNGPCDRTWRVLSAAFISWIARRILQRRPAAHGTWPRR